MLKFPKLFGGGEGGRTLSRFLWSLGSVLSNFGLRLGSAVVLTRLLDPHTLGIMVLINALRLGIELLTDVGIEQNIVKHKEGLEPPFFNTAWTLQIIRGVAISTLFLIASPFVADFYDVDPRVFALVALIPLINSLHSTSIFALVKNLEVKRRTLFEFRSEFVGFVASVVLALISPTVWALIGGALISVAFRSAMSYGLPHPKHRLTLDRVHVGEILTFGRWIMASSMVMFAASNLDRLALGKVAPLALLGIYGMARSVGDIPANMARKISYQVIFPMLSEAAGKEGEDGVRKLTPIRLKLVLVTAVVIGVGAGSADWAVRILYDPRYAAAGWMLSILLMATWLSILSNFNEAVLLGSGKPAYESGGNALRFCILAVGLWVGYRSAGFAGAICAVILGEAGRYAFIQFGQRRYKLSFLRQDVLATVTMLAVLALWLTARHFLGLGAPWDIALKGQ